ncbi:MAG: BamA/TamA family outer membrane protein, partial [Phycisphaerae bacterium]|nr:BamA/TamA family outer membrane protein [Phycisphaerae bacterium]
PYQFGDKNFHYSLKLDLTDDYLDPRKGARFDLKYQNVPGQTLNDPDYFRVDTGLTFYLPFRRNDTLALNYYRSDAYVTRIGNVDPASIRAELNAKCQPTDTACLIAEEELVNSFINERTYGTATSLGGDNRLRAYPQGRFSGGHMAFAGAEYRWNFVQDAKPFDYFIWKDVTTTLQLSFFAEAGTVAEHAANLWNDYRTSYGVGGRIVSASGSVYRAEIAQGDEGSQFI